MSTPEEDLGPFYSEAGLCRRWERNPEDVATKILLGRLLGLPTDDGSTVYPAFQFMDPDHPKPDDMLPHLSYLMEVLEEAGNGPLSIAAWLTAPDPRLSDAQRAEDWISAVEFLRQGGDPKVMVQAAMSDVERWSH